MMKKLEIMKKRCLQNVLPPNLFKIEEEEGDLARTARSASEGKIRSRATPTL